MKIMEEFPHSSMLLQKNIKIELGQDIQAKPSDEEEELNLKKIWQFKAENEYKLNITSNSLDISSEYHKTYQLGDGVKFRSLIQSAVESFLGLISLPVISRIGLRYIDECPVPSRNNRTFKRWYNTALPLHKFDMQNTPRMEFRTVVDHEDYHLRYIEALMQNEETGKDVLMFDCDAFTENIKPESYLEVTDHL